MHLRDAKQDSKRSKTIIDIGVLEREMDRQNGEPSRQCSLGGAEQGHRSQAGRGKDQSADDMASLAVEPIQSARAMVGLMEAPQEFPIMAPAVHPIETEIDDHGDSQYIGPKGPVFRPKVEREHRTARRIDDEDAGLQQDDAKIDGKTYNIGYENHSLMKIADIVKSVVGNNVEVAVEPTDDLRSYHVSSEKIRRELGFAPTHTIEQAVSGLVDAFKAGRLPNSLNDPRYFNIKMMQNISLK